MLLLLTIAKKYRFINRKQENDRLVIICYVIIIVVDYEKH